MEYPARPGSPQANDGSSAVGEPRVTIALAAREPEDIAAVLAALFRTVVRDAPAAEATGGPGADGGVFDAIVGSPGPGVVHRLAGVLGSDHGRSLSISSPPPVTGMIPRRTTWVTVPMPGERPGRATVRIDSRLATPRRFILVSDLVDHPGESPLALLSRFLHPRDRLRARIVGGDPLATVATFSIRPSLVVVIAPTPDGQARVAVTTDPLAAELVAVAHGARGQHHEDAWDRPGPEQPWEDPVVQRATAAGLGVDHPSQLALVEVTQAGMNDVSGVLSRPSEWVVELAMRLGTHAATVATPAV
ncbi:MAG: hypothetical protein WKF80_00045 [Thermomicrobiales bacterium]